MTPDFDEYGIGVRPKAAPSVNKSSTNDYDEYGIGIKKNGSVGGNGSTPAVQPTSASNSQSVSPDDNGVLGVGNVLKTIAPPVPETLQTSDGVTIPVTKQLPYPDQKTGVSVLQQKINTKTYTPDDVAAIAGASSKSVDSIQAYLDKGKEAGLAVDISDQEKKDSTDITQGIQQINSLMGTKFNPDEVLASSDKLADLSNQVKEFTKKQATLNALSNPELYAQTEASGGSVTNPRIKDASIIAANNFVEKLKNLVVLKTTEEEYDKKTPKDQILTKILQKADPDGYNLSVQANKPTMQDISESISPFGNPAAALGSLFRNDTENNDLIESQKGYADMLYNNSLATLGSRKKAQGIITGNSDLTTEGNNILSTVDSDVISKYPSLQKQQIAQQVNEYIAKQSGVVEGSNAQDGHFLESAFGSSTNDRIDAMQALGILDDPSKKDLALSMAGNSTYFANNSILGGVVPSFLQPLADLGMSLGDISGWRNNKDIVADKIKDQLYEKEFSDNSTTPLKTGVSTFRNIFNTTSNLAGMMSIAALTEGVAGEAGIGLSAGESAAIEGGGLDFGTLASLSNKAKSLAGVRASLGAWTSFGLPSFDASLKDSKSFIDDQPGQYLYATLNAAANAEGGRLLDLGKILRSPLQDEFAKIANGDISKDAATELLYSPKTKNKYLDWVKNYGANVTKGAATMAYFNIVNNTLKLAFGDPSVGAYDILPQAAHSFLNGVLGMSIMGAFGGAADMNNEKNTTYKGTIYSMALNHDATKSIFEIGYKNGDYTKAQFDQNIQLLNTAKAAKSAIDATENKTGITLDQNQKAVFVANRTAEAMLRARAENPDTNDQDKTKYLSQADRLKQQSVQILDGLKFTPTLEPMYDVYTAKKERDDALDNLNEDNTPENQQAFADKNKVFNDLLVKNFTKVKPKEPIKPVEAPKTVEEEPATKEEIQSFPKEDQIAYTKAIVEQDTEKANEIVNKNRGIVTPEVKAVTKTDTAPAEEDASTLQDKLAAARETLPSIPLTDKEQTNWDNTPLSEKLAAARANLPAMDGVSEIETRRLADQNAKLLLAKLHGTPIPENRTPEGEIKSDNPEIIRLQKQKQFITKERDNPPATMVDETNNIGKPTGKKVAIPLGDEELKTYTKNKNEDIAGIDEKINTIHQQDFQNESQQVENDHTQKLKDAQKPEIPLKFITGSILNEKVGGKEKVQYKDGKSVKRWKTVKSEQGKIQKEHKILENLVNCE